VSGVSVPVNLEAVATGYGDNTPVWLPQGIAFVDKMVGGPTWPVRVEAWPVPEHDTKYQVTVSNVMISGVAHSFTYPVTIFDPATPGSRKPVMAPTYPLMLD
jgi:hypothetical protein